MYMRAVTVRIVYVGIVSLGILLSAAFRDSSGSVKYRVMKDGAIRNSSGSLIGKIDRR